MQNGRQSQRKDVIMKVYMHCEGCASQVSNCLKGYDGVEQVKTEIEENKVIVSGKFDDPEKILQRVKKKFSRNAELISPKPNPKQEKKESPKKEPPPQIKTAVLKIYMHCEGCVHEIKRGIGKMEGVLTVEPDMSKSTVVVRGAIDPPKVVEEVKKRMGRHAELISQRSENKNHNAQKEASCEKGNNVFTYPPQYSIQHSYPCQLFSDENANSCSIM
ncbi:PREDICTED: heavy metal-associated isoprenylated plant protein 3 [Tarenaya hassleriana]|uniref:heavy metal-associated isoprenylated plant protein 3 n=1 Tax=Tarenaya hassleriana TaxID=28532 RepID=UPI00053C15E2|nr:PREDICTED: heavy metal-associated isoprenylated plant protein 3 [Tarenaya hassleriana]